MSPELAAPVPASERIQALDVLRGFALFGILVVNVAYFGLPTAAAGAPWRGEPFTGVVAWVVTEAFFELKFVAVFALLFGMGLVLQAERARRRGVDPARPALRRMAVLGAIGLVHALLFFEGDVLLPYALIGLALYLCREWRAGALLLTAAVLFGIGLGFTFLWSVYEVISGEAALSEPRLEGPPILGSDASWALADLYSGDAQRRTQAELGFHLTSSFRQATLYRAAQSALWILWATISSFHWRVAAFFFLGAAAAKWGLLAATRRHLHRLLVVAGLFLGGGAELLGVALTFRNDFQPGLHQLLISFLHELGSVALTAAYVAGVLLFANGGPARWLAHGLACAGRMALSNYVGQSLVASLVFYGYGLGWYGALPRAWLLLLTVPFFALQVAASAAWLRTFRSGPLEWVWRSLAYGRRQPLFWSDSAAT